MPMMVESTRFGAVEVADESVITFPRGLIGLGGSAFALVATGEDDAISWLHSLEDPDLAVPVADPWVFFPEFAVELSDEEAERIGVTSPEEARVLVTIRAGATPEDCFANLRAPILVAGRNGHQVINDAPGAELRAPLA